MSLVSRDPNSLLSRIATAKALTESGYPIKAKTLDTMASRGGGPPYRLWSKVALYRWGDALHWAQERLSDPRADTSACDAKGKTCRAAQNPRLSASTDGPERGNSPPTDHHQ